jgi:hypothetical protein
MRDGANGLSTWNAVERILRPLMIASQSSVDAEM